MIRQYFRVVLLLLFFQTLACADIIDELKVKQAAIKTVSAEFFQEKKTKLLTRPIRAEGSFLYRQPDKIKWEYRGSVNMQVFFNGKDIWLYYPDLKEADKLSGISQYGSMMHFDLNNMSRDYSVTAKKDKGMILLSMLPKVKGFIGRIEMELSDDMSFPHIVKIFDKNNDPTTITFRNIKLNAEIKDSMFSFVPGSGVTVRERSLR